MTDIPPVCDYEGSDYRTRFWEGQGRDYEDQVERIALRRLMPPTGTTLIEIGAGYGRLADEYRGYEKVVLFDYSRSLLREAQTHLGHDPRFMYVAGNWYNMPFVNNLFMTMVQIRTLHHAADVPTLFQELKRISQPNGHYVLEFANKKNLKAIFRYGTKRQTWSPFAHEPVEFVKLNFDFHPQWIREELLAVGFSPGRTLTVSHYRFAPLKKAVPTNLLVKLDSWAQLTGKWWQLSPSVFVHVQQPKQKETNTNAAPASLDLTAHFFACPHCKTPLSVPHEDILTCRNQTCGRQWGITDGLYDFKEPLP